MEDWQSLIIDIIGWIYFFAWSFSFYGQIYENFKHKSVEGMNFDFVAMNLTGFTFYSLYCSYGYFVNTQQTGQVDLNDLLFAYHALFATLVTLGQVLYFPKKSNKIHSYTILYLLALWIFSIVYSVLTEGTKTIQVDSALGIISLMGYFKISISFLKYLPQFYWNYKRKSTKGWSIANILLDLTGGTFSFAQMALEAIFGQDVQINIVKLILGIMVVFYDIGFIVQHYCLYSDNKTNLAVISKYKQPARNEVMQASLLDSIQEKENDDEPAEQAGKTKKEGEQENQNEEPLMNLST